MAHEGELEGCEVVLAANLEALGDSLGLIFVFSVFVSVTLEGRRSLGL